MIAAVGATPMHGLLWLLATYAVADAVAKARIGAPLRRRFPLRGEDGPGPDDKAISVGHLVRCPKCVAAWTSPALTVLGLGPAAGIVLPFLLPGVWDTVATLVVRYGLNALAAYACTWFINVAVTKLGSEAL